ncbi:BamA/TamA family outer membrane protein [soil metagenome]
MRAPFILLVLYCLSYPGFAAGGLGDSTRTSRPALLRDQKFVPVPVVFRLPETGIGGGGVVASTFSFARDTLGAKPSQLSFGVTFTERRQVLVFLPFTAFYGDNRYYFSGDNGWYRYKYFYFGIGENRVDEELFDVTFPRVRLVGARLVAPNTYAGLRYQFERYNVTRTDLGGELASGRISGSDFSRTSSLGVSFLRDTRDQFFYPRSGIFGEFYVLPTAKILGADRNFARVYLDVAHYQSLSPNLVLATNYVGSAIFGQDVPFNQLSFMGGQKKMRGIFDGYFRDKNVVMAQAEARWEITRRIGLVGFGAVGWMGNEQDLLRVDKPKYTYGMGLRLNAQRENHLNIRLDYGMSPYGPGNFYATIGEAF